MKAESTIRNHFRAAMRRIPHGKGGAFTAGVVAALGWVLWEPAYRPNPTRAIDARQAWLQHHKENEQRRVRLLAEGREGGCGMNITIANARDYIKDGRVVLPETAVYVGRDVKRYRLKASPLANPYKFGMVVPRGAGSNRVALTRKTAIAEFGRYLSNQLAWEATLHYKPGCRPLVTVPEETRRLRSLAEAGPLILVCWCETWDGIGEAPGKCHAEIIREYMLREATE